MGRDPIGEDTGMISLKMKHSEGFEGPALIRINGNLGN